jgi:hypothetical protein
MNKEEYDTLMAAEMQKWADLNANPGAYMPSEGLLGMIFRFEVLHKLLVEKEIITEEEADDMYREVALTGLAMVRETVIEPAIKQAREDQIRGMVNVPTMHIPRNKKH